MPTSAYVIGFLVVALTALFAVAYRYVPLYRAYQTTDAYGRARAIRREVGRLHEDLSLCSIPRELAVPEQSVRDALAAIKSDGFIVGDPPMIRIEAL